MLRIVIFTLILLIYCADHAFCFDLDMTIEDDIRKNYNSSRLVKDTKTEDLEELPALPDKLNNGSAKTNTNTKNVKYTAPTITTFKQGNVKIRKGTSFNVFSTIKISDWQKAGTVVKFKTNNQIAKRSYVIPKGTVFIGEILESHQPQITCNGGLVVIRIRSMIYKNETIPVNAYVTRADGKLIFLNDIKGERKYLKTVWKKGNWGRSLFGRMMNLTVSLGKDGATLALSPFPIMYGTICFGANALISPITAFFEKGGHVLIPPGSCFRIKLLEDTFID